MKKNIMITTSHVRHLHPEPFSERTVSLTEAWASENYGECVEEGRFTRHVRGQYDAGRGDRRQVDERIERDENT